MEVPSSLRMFSHKFPNEKAKQEQYQPPNRDRILSKQKKSRRQLFRDNSLKSKDRNDSLRTEKRPSISRNVCNETNTLESIDGNSTTDENSEWKLILEYFHRELNRDIDGIGVERSDGTAEMIKNSKGFSQIYFHSVNGARSLNDIMTIDQSQFVDIEYKLVPVIERISIRKRNQSDECTVYTSMKLRHDNYENLAEFVDESSSMGYASQTNATELSILNDSSMPMENDFHPIGSSTMMSTEEKDGDQKNADTFEMVDMDSCLNDSQLSIYYECEASSMADETITIDRCHQM